MVLQEPVSNSISIFAIPEPLSLAVHWKVADDELMYDPDVGEVMLTLGATVSTMNVTDAVFMFPA
jgi:hypothetical protein